MIGFLLLVAAILIWQKVAANGSLSPDIGNEVVSGDRRPAGTQGLRSEASPLPPTATRLSSASTPDASALVSGTRAPMEERPAPVSHLLTRGRLAALAAAPSSNLLAAGAATGAYLFDAGTLEVADYIPTASPVLALTVLSGTGEQRASLVILTAGGRVYRRSPAAGATLPPPLVLEQATGDLTAAALAPGATLAATLSGNARSGSEIRIYDLASGALRQILNAHGGRAEQLLFLAARPGSTMVPYLVTRGNDGRVRLWHGARWRELRLPAALSWGVATLATTWDATRGDPLLVAAHVDGRVSLWNARTWQRLPLAGADRAGPVGALALSPDGSRLAAAGVDGSRTLWDISDGTWLGACTANSTQLAFLGDPPLLVTLDVDGRLRSWAATTACPDTPLAASNPDRPFVERLDFVARGSAATLATAGETGRIFLWDLDRETVTGVLDPGGPVGALAYGPEGLLAAGGVAGIRIWQAGTGELRHDLGGHVATRPQRANVTALAFSPAASGESAGVLASADRSGLLKLWRAEDGAMLRNVLLPPAPVTSLSFSADGYYLLVGSGAGVSVWQPRRNQLVREVAPAGVAVGAPLSPETWQGTWEMIAVLRGPRIELYDEEGDHLRTLQAVLAGTDADVATATAATFLHPADEEGRLLLATGHDDGRVRIWDPATGTLLRAAAAHPGRVTALAAAGCRLVSSGSFGTLRVENVCEPDGTGE